MERQYFVRKMKDNETSQSSIEPFGDHCRLMFSCRPHEKSDDRYQFAANLDFAGAKLTDLMVLACGGESVRVRLQRAWREHVANGGSPTDFDVSNISVAKLMESTRRALSQRDKILRDARKAGVPDATIKAMLEAYDAAQHVDEAA